MMSYSDGEALDKEAPPIQLRPPQTDEGGRPAFEPTANPIPEGEGRDRKATASATPDPEPEGNRKGAKDNLRQEAQAKLGEVLGTLTHLRVEAPKVVKVVDIIVTNLSISREGKDLQSLDFERGEGHTEEQPVVVRKADSQSTITSIMENRAIWVPINVTTRTPTPDHPEPYRVIDGRTRLEGAKEAALGEIPAIVWSGFRGAEEEKVLGILMNTARRSIDQAYRSAAISQLISYEERLVPEGRQRYRTGFNRLARLAGYKKGGNEAVAQYERANWFGRWVTYVGGKEKRLDANGRALKIISPLAVTQRWSPEQVLVQFHLHEHEPEITDTVLARIKSHVSTLKDEHKTDTDPLGAWQRHTLPQFEDALQAAQVYAEVWQESVKSTAALEEALPENSAHAPSESPTVSPDSDEEVVDERDGRIEAVEMDEVKDPDNWDSVRQPHSLDCLAAMEGFRRPGRKGSIDDTDYLARAEIAPRKPEPHLAERYAFDLADAKSLLDEVPDPDQIDWHGRQGTRALLGVALAQRWLIKTTNAAPDEADAPLFNKVQKVFYAAGRLLKESRQPQEVGSVEPPAESRGEPGRQEAVDPSAAAPIAAPSESPAGSDTGAQAEVLPAGRPMIRRRHSRRGLAERGETICREGLSN